MSERDEYTPPMGQIRSAYADTAHSDARQDALLAAFDRALAAHDKALREQVAREYGVGDLTSRPLYDAQERIRQLEDLVNYIRRENSLLENSIALWEGSE